MPALTHFCHIESDHTCCSPYAILAINRVLFNSHLCLKRKRLREKKRKQDEFK